MDEQLMRGEEQVVEEDLELDVQEVSDDSNLESQDILETGSDPAQAPANLKDTVDLLVQQNRFLLQQVEALKTGTPQQQQPVQQERDPVAEILESMGDEEFVDKNTFGNALSKVVKIVTEQNQQVKQETEAEVQERRIRESEDRLVQEIPEFRQMFKKYLANEYFGNPHFRSYIDSSPDPARKAWQEIQKLPEYRQEVLQRKAQQRKQNPEKERQSVTTTGMSGSAPDRKHNYEKMSLAEIRAESDKMIRGISR